MSKCYQEDLKHGIMQLHDKQMKIFLTRIIPKGDKILSLAKIY